MSYFDSVQNPSTFKQKAQSEKPLSRSVPGAVNTSSHFGYSEKKSLALDARLQALIHGPAEGNQALSSLSEPQIVRSYSPDSLGSVWAALGALLRPQSTRGSDDPPQDSGRPVRERHQPDFGDVVPPDSVQFGSSPLNRPTTSSSATSSVGYTENPQVPAVEDLTLRLASCFVRFVLNYSQGDSTPTLEFHDERSSASYQLRTGPASTASIQAIDDGGVRMFQPGDESLGVALVEAKRSFQAIEEGRPTVSDGLLAQMVGQALLTRLDSLKHKLVSRTSVTTIQATKHYLRFFSFEPSAPSYLRRVDSLSAANDGSLEGLHLVVKSSEWFDIGTKTGREMVVRHLLALVKWAHEELEIGTDEDLDDDRYMED
ncbi:hypothetical protein C8A01DRAFT_39245 [Parachaetomium inaequale]|uniref:Uncharacterized protein n=1 Tax=Parachaetomium inaequale TaxID=2588326 RepID=A0AAN6P9M0_9PEZI|nr:hypothetical protein C8A01DRAFT_39245 [Parachaetomium inaequale]